MIRNFLLILVFVTFTNFTTTNPKERKTTRIATVKNNDTFKIPFLQKDFIGFKEALAFKESQGKYTIVNKLGYLGKYQFGKNTLHRLGIYNTYLFLKNPELQERTFVALCKLNKWILRRDIKRNLGKKIKGIEITESGILAAAHLSGAGNVKKFLRTKGHSNAQDAFGTSIAFYMKKFSHYDVSNIIANKRPRV
ncbi:peptidoglycan-binding protein LysM [Tenacibaculum maritimum]|nr:peptidoglycan-binding protein LysM [Tenacibaculum maritimum]MCD9561802.1 peptidoglycan-binding protein LysM [Tenacibaculum maritimum]MCD9565238.1 peptidoglycan-binding protein LysM [Tenacibaculum maritimum]MCD9578638.1 peptidoglycan-binding protein LysM [Tenacibaculum maritimum]MCD9585234.1 peptidoglycan-binding protein LysM [Tenacibaculum maritimum]MCD9596482.1 peptidoglycan-binding protein LysM [Tenacibaculum maritimum]